jgi:hypothetical protein
MNAIEVVLLVAVVYAVVLVLHALERKDSTTVTDP